MVEQLRAQPFNDRTAVGAAVQWLNGRAHGPMIGLGTDHVTGVADERPGTSFAPLGLDGAHRHTDRQTDRTTDMATL